MKSDCPECQDASRRAFLKKVAGGAAAFTLLGAIGSCSDDLPEMKVGDLSEMEKGPLTPKFNGTRILARRLDGEIVVFSLTCRHKACTVKWKAERTRFECPCHEGVYDERGKVISGPPPGPLRRYTYEVRGEELWVLNEFEKG
ncbi:MAG: ubiquinol-cytochrome c reductase iron-sulfur subunit [Bacteroidota bacterium]